MGTVNYNTFMLDLNNENLDETQNPRSIPIRRTPDNFRVRPNGSTRHSMTEHEEVQDAKLARSQHLVSDTDTEWMSINYRMGKAAKLADSNRRVILVLFQEGF